MVYRTAILSPGWVGGVVVVVELAPSACVEHAGVKAEASAHLLVPEGVHPVEVLLGHEALPGHGAGAVLQGLRHTVLALARLL